MITFATDDKEVVETFAANDPYVRGGAVKSWRVERWTVVVGDGAE